jgi:ribose 1,5-bisphosphokinase
VVFNGSRAALPVIRARYADAQVLMITASREALAERLRARGRENARAIAARLKRADMAPPSGAHVITNDGSVEQALQQMLRALNLPEESA